MDIQPDIVYVRIDDQGRITAVNSSAFLIDAGDWREIDRGYGDKYHHAHGNYFDKSIYDERGIYRYKVADGEIVMRTQEEMDEDFAARPAPPPTDAQRIASLEVRNAYLEEALSLLLSGVTGEEEEDGESVEGEGD